jgi:hypothetical protein
MTDDSRLTAPTLHLNGSGYTRLAAQYRHAADALRVALEALREMTPHDRDYYVQGADAGPKARREHEARIARVSDVLREIEALHAQIREQEQERKRGFAKRFE